MGTYSRKAPLNKREPMSHEMPSKARSSDRAEPNRGEREMPKQRDGNEGRNRGVQFQRLQENQAYHAQAGKMGDEPTHGRELGDIPEPGQ